MIIQEHETEVVCERCEGEGVLIAEGNTTRERMLEISCMDLKGLIWRDLLRLAKGKTVSCPDCDGKGRGMYHWAELQGE